MEKTLIQQREERTEWFTQARFGMFIHWGLYAIPARGEWVRNRERTPSEEYVPFMDEFTAENYDPRQWAKLAKKAGMKYAVLTAKHHDGFCLYDSAYTDYKSTNAPCKRDLVREFLEAFRAEGIRVGLYFSLIDWQHPDYPHYGDMHHPMRDNEAFKGKTHDRNNYLTYMHNQVRELLTNYGHIDIMWYDFSYEGMSGADWKAQELMEMVRSLQPHLVVDNRLEGYGPKFGSILTGDPTIFAGDFASPEQMIPPQGIRNDLGDIIPWESCITLNNNWGYASSDYHYKTPKMVIRALVDCVSKNGNLLLNVGPDATGRIPKESVEILTQVGEWMERNGDSIYGCGMSDFPKPEWGRFTQKGEYLYAHVFEEQVAAVCLPGFAGKIDSMRLLSDGSEVLPIVPWNLVAYPNDVFFYTNPGTRDCYPLPDERDTVVKIKLK